MDQPRCLGVKVGFPGAPCRFGSVPAREWCGRRGDTATRETDHRALPWAERQARSLAPSLPSTTTAGETGYRPKPTHLPDLGPADPTACGPI